MQRGVDQELTGEPESGIGGAQFCESGILVSVTGREDRSGGRHFDDAGATAAHAFTFTEIVVIDLVEEEQHEVAVFTGIGVQGDGLVAADNMDGYFYFIQNFYLTRFTAEVVIS